MGISETLARRLVYTNITDVMNDDKINPCDVGKRALPGIMGVLESCIIRK